MAETKVYSNTKEGLNLRKRIPAEDYYATGVSKVHYARFETIETTKLCLEVNKIHGLTQKSAVTSEGQLNLHYRIRVNSMALGMACATQ